METIGQRVRRLREAADLSQEQLAKRCGVTQGTISQQEEEPQRRSKFLPQMASALKVSVEYLLTGKDVPQIQMERAVYNAHQIVENPPVPLISLVRAGTMKPIGDELDHQHFADVPWVAPRKRVGPRSWALEVEGYSMHDGSERGIGPGWRLICDTDRAATAGALVIAKNVEDRAATFKQLIYEDGEWLLRPLNKDPIYKTVKIDDPAIRVIAVVAEAIPPSLIF